MGGLIYLLMDFLEEWGGGNFECEVSNPSLNNQILLALQP